MTENEHNIDEEQETKEERKTEDTSNDNKTSKSNKRYKAITRRQRAILTISTITMILVLLLNCLSVLFNMTDVITKQTGLIALIESSYVPPDIPDYDPGSVPIPDNDKTKELNEKLEKGKMCINMISKITLQDTYSSGYFNIINDEANNYPQFVTLILDSNEMTVYQSGLIAPGKCIPYATLDVALPAGSYECTAVFAQVDTESSKICGKAAAKVVLNIKN